METTVLGSLMTDDYHIAVFGNDYMAFVMRTIQRDGFPDLLEELFFASLKDCRSVRDIREPCLRYLCFLLVNKMLNFYLKVMLSDLIKYILRKLHYDKCISRLSFRTQTLYTQIQSSSLSLPSVAEDADM
jgi:hypothetical protein